MIRLSKRLAAVSTLLEGTGSVLDVGTDHGRLPALLAQRGAAALVAASDIREGPLQSARRTAEEQGVLDRVAFYLTDGLTSLPPFDEVVCAGMGGETIVSILDPAPWTKNARLILQPQSKVEELCAWLMDRGYRPLDALLVRDAGRLYTAFSVTGGAAAGDPEEVFLIGPLAARHDPLLGEYLTLLESRARRALDGLERGRESREELLVPLRKRLAKIEQWKERYP